MPKQQELIVYLDDDADKPIYCIFCDVNIKKCIYWKHVLTEEHRDSRYSFLKWRPNGMHCVHDQARYEVAKGEDCRHLIREEYQDGRPKFICGIEFSSALKSDGSLTGDSLMGEGNYNPLPNRPTECFNARS